MKCSEVVDLQARLKSRKDAVELARLSDGRYSEATLLSLFAQTYRWELKRRSSGIWDRIPRYRARHESGERLIDMALADDVPPCMLAKRVLEPLGKKAVAGWLKNPASVGDARLRADLELCVLKDEHCAPAQDIASREVGKLYERILEEKMNSFQVPYETEEDLRRRGVFKTPDVLLDVPIGMNDRVVCRIDSKAKFGDLISLQEDYKASIASYVRRYGPGVVIYWFDFIEDADARFAPIIDDPSVYLVDHFPENIYLLPGTGPE